MTFSLQMNLTDFNFPTFISQPMRDPLQWPHDAAAEAMVFSTHDTGGFYSNNNTKNNAWSETGAVHQQLTSIARSPSEGSNDTVNSKPSLVSQLCTNIHASHTAKLVSPHQISASIAAQHKAWSWKTTSLSRQTSTLLPRPAMRAS